MMESKKKAFSLYDIVMIGLMAAVAVLAVMVYMLFIKRCPETGKLTKETWTNRR